MKIESQNKTILQIMKQGGKLTALDAMQIGCMRLASRICDLRNEGHGIQDEWIESNGKRFKRYYIS